MKLIKRILMCLFIIIMSALYFQNTVKADVIDLPEFENISNNSNSTYLNSVNSNDTEYNTIEANITDFDNTEFNFVETNTIQTDNTMEAKTLNEVKNNNIITTSLLAVGFVAIIVGISILLLNKQKK